MPKVDLWRFRWECLNYDANKSTVDTYYSYKDIEVRMTV